MPPNHSLQPTAPSLRSVAAAELGAVSPLCGSDNGNAVPVVAYKMALSDLIFRVGKCGK